MAVRPNTIAETAVVELLSTIFENVAYMDPGTVENNIKLACDGGMSKSDRSIKADLANYLMNNFALIYLGLIVNEEFRDTVKEAVSVEIILDTKSVDFVNQIRNDMQSSVAESSKGSYVINLGKYNDGAYKKLNGKLFDSFDKIRHYDKAVDSFISNMTDQQKIVIGFCFSNFMYLIRAFTKNPLFTNYVKTIVNSVKHQLKIAV